MKRTALTITVLAFLGLAVGALARSFVPVADTIAHEAAPSVEVPGGARSSAPPPFREPAVNAPAERDQTRFHAVDPANIPVMPAGMSNAGDKDVTCPGKEPCGPER